MVPRVRTADRHPPVFPAHDGGFWEQDDWRNWRRASGTANPSGRDATARTRRLARRMRAGHAAADLRSSYVTLRVYEGVPLTQIAQRSARASG